MEISHYVCDDCASSNHAARRVSASLRAAFSDALAMGRLPAAGQRSMKIELYLKKF
jgi:hypothetical protein